MAMAGDETKAPKEPTAAERRDAEAKAAEKEAARAEEQRVKALRLQFGPIRDPE
jgi:hypothetical protein